MSNPCQNTELVEFNIYKFSHLKEPESLLTVVGATFSFFSDELQRKPYRTVLVPKGTTRHRGHEGDFVTLPDGRSIPIRTLMSKGY